MKVSLVGIGPGAETLLTGQARAALERCDAVLGAHRALEALPDTVRAPRFEAVAADKLAAILKAHPGWTQACVALTGDVGFYSGARALAPLLSGCEVEALCGVSSVQYLCAKLLRPWQELRLVSGHGTVLDAAAEVRNAAACFFLTACARP